MPDMQLAHTRRESSCVPGIGSRVAFFFTVHNWTGVPENREPDKCSGLRWFSLDELPDRLIPYCRTALESIAADYCFSTFGW